MNLKEKLALQDQLRLVEGQRATFESRIPGGFLYSPAGEFYWIGEEPHGTALAELEGSDDDGNPDGYFISDVGSFKNWGRGTLTIKERSYPESKLFVAIEPYKNMVHVVYSDDLRTIGYDDFDIDQMAEESDYLAQMGAAQAKRYLDDAGIPNQIIVDDFMRTGKTKIARYGLQDFATGVIFRPFEKDESGKWLEQNTWLAAVAPDASEMWAHVDVIYMNIPPEARTKVSVGMIRREAYANLRRHLYSPLSQGLILFTGPLELRPENAETFQAAIEFAIDVYEKSGFPVSHYGLLSEDLAQAQGAHWGFEGPPPVLWDEVTPAKIKDYVNVIFNLFTIDEEDYAEPSRRTEEVNPHADQSWWEEQLQPQNALDIIRNQNKPFNPLGKTSHWIDGYIAIILDDDGIARLGHNENTYHPELRRINGMTDRGLYNPTTQHLLILGNEEDRGSDERYYNDIMPIGYDPTDTREKWKRGVERIDLPVSRIDFLFAQRETNPFRAIDDGMSPQDYVVAEDPFQQQLQMPLRGAKTSHWIDGFYAVILSRDGKLAIANEENDMHGAKYMWEETGVNSFNDFGRGLYNPQTKVLYVIRDVDEDAPEMLDWPEPSDEQVLQSKQLWLDAFARKGIEVIWGGRIGKITNEDAPIIQVKEPMVEKPYELQAYAKVNTPPLDQMQLFTNVRRLRDVLIYDTKKV